jgi:hypothetical protein
VLAGGEQGHSMAGRMSHMMSTLDGFIADFTRRLAGNRLLHLGLRERSNRH